MFHSCRVRVGDEIGVDAHVGSLTLRHRSCDVATIGLSIESGAIRAVLFDIDADAVLSSRIEKLDVDASDAVANAVSTMGARAADLAVIVDAVGLVYRDESERRAFQRVMHGRDGHVELVSAQDAFWSWMAGSADLSSASCALLYHLGDSGVCLSLVDAENYTLTTPRTASLESMSPEHIGSTVPLAWSVIDEAGRTPDVIALFGDRSDNRDLTDILALGLGTPVVRVENATELAAIGAARLASAAAVHAGVDSPADAAVPPTPVDDVFSEEAGEPAVEVPEAAPVLSEPVAAGETSTTRTRRSGAGAWSRRAIPRRKLVTTAALLAALLSGGVALAATLPTEEPSTEVIEAEMARATQPIEPAPTETAPGESTPSEVVAAIPNPPSDVPMPAPAPPQPVPTVLDDESSVATTSVPTPESRMGMGRNEALVPIPAGSIPPGAALVPAPAVEPPALTLPPVIPEPGKSPEQWEQDAWDRHWQQTGEWLKQQLSGN